VPAAGLTIIFFLIAGFFTMLSFSSDFSSFFFSSLSSSPSLLSDSLPIFFFSLFFGAYFVSSLAASEEAAVFIPNLFFFSPAIPAPRAPPIFSFGGAAGFSITVFF
jgi:hypothetical protein